MSWWEGRCLFSGIVPVIEYIHILALPYKMCSVTSVQALSVYYESFSQGFYNKLFTTDIQENIIFMNRLNILVYTSCFNLYITVQEYCRTRQILSFEYYSLMIHNIILSCTDSTVTLQTLSGFLRQIITISWHASSKQVSHSGKQYGYVKEGNSVSSVVFLSLTL